ncbi:hypothetical protein D9757_011164 [Collybiopsis confluens]|uniref:Uncharacterized protein n=1 Tax=Collybiopsis confluens TaxID=2823264 RepID=A0A8H5H7Z8_9AGAR|nr:hypothetical protein D9757_011164 [Collybiopsis confluens]
MPIAEAFPFTRHPPHFRAAKYRCFLLVFKNAGEVKVCVQEEKESQMVEAHEMPVGAFHFGRKVRLMYRSINSPTVALRLVNINTPAVRLAKRAFPLSGPRAPSRRFIASRINFREAAPPVIHSNLVTFLSGSFNPSVALVTVHHPVECPLNTIHSLVRHPSLPLLVYRCGGFMGDRMGVCSTVGIYGRQNIMLLVRRL